MNLLFICSKNKWRSRTAETIFRNSTLHHVRSAGTDGKAQVKVNEKQLVWADMIFVMEKKHKELIIERFTDAIPAGKIIVFDIPDDYQYMDKELILTLRNSLSLYLVIES